MGRRPHLSLVLGLLLLACFVAVPAQPAHAAEGSNAATTHFSQQLNANARAIYDKLVEAFKSGAMKDGKTDIDITSTTTQESIQAYAEKGNRNLFNDFTAAKDAFDLEHPEAWYVDSSYLCLRVGKNDSTGAYVALVGPGRAKTYYLNGQSSYKSNDGGSETALTSGTIQSMDNQLNTALEKLVTEVTSLTKGANESDESFTTRKIKAAHDAVIRTISYRFEDECKTGHSLFVRTLYGAYTHEGVCEAYARTLQYVLGRVGVPCILVNGLQTSGDSPEQHMWCYVQINETWYGVDPTWDDPIKLNADGSIAASDSNNPGKDGGERTLYLLAGSTTLFNWVPSGQFSAGGFEFTYPPLSEKDYAGGEVFSQNGLSVNYSSAAEMEGVAAGSYEVRFEGEGIMKAGKRGYHLLIKMHAYDDKDGKYSFEDWYYVEAGIHIANNDGMNNQYFNDNEDRLLVIVPQCDYLEFAITTQTPKGYDTWESGIGADYSGAYVKDNEADLLCYTGKLYNVNCEHKANPYVYRQMPIATSRTATGTHIAKVMFDDDLTYLKAKTDLDGKHFTNAKPARDDAYVDYNGDPETSAVKDGFEDLIRVPESVAHLMTSNSYKGDNTLAKIKVSYLQKDTITGEEKPHTLQGKVNYDDDGLNGMGDGYVDADTAHLNWLYDCNITYPHKHVPYGYEKEGHHCSLVGVEFEFTPSAMWADDLTYYEFTVEGLVGGSSGKQANPWGYLVCSPECPFAYRSQGIDWNLWGRPNLLDNVGDLDLSQVTLEGADNYNKKLDDLQKEMNLERLDGRLTLVVEDLSGKQEEGKLEDLLEKEGIPSEGIKSKSLFEINFSNICRKTINEVQTGDSMRVQVGFPGGYDANSNVVYKAYHFTRNDAGEIIDVEEIPVAVTPYGLVVLCNSFSPFEIVQLDANNHQVQEAMSKSTVGYDKSIIVASDGHARVLANGKDATSGIGSIVSLSDGSEHTFTFTPNVGYQIQGVTVDGVVRALADNGGGSKTLTLKADEVQSLTTVGNGTPHNTILSVTTIPTDVAASDNAHGFTEVTPTTCSHAKTSQGQEIPPTCTTEGHLGGNVCKNCGTQLEPTTPIPALGHLYGTNGVCVHCGSYDPSEDKVYVDEKALLEAELKAGESLRSSDYTAPSWAVYAQARKAAEDLLASLPGTSDKSSSTEVRKALEALEAAREALVNAITDPGPGSDTEPEKDPSEEEGTLPEQTLPEQMAGSVTDSATTDAIEEAASEWANVEPGVADDDGNVTWTVEITDGGTSAATVASGIVGNIVTGLRGGVAHAESAIATSVQGADTVAPLDLKSCTPEEEAAFSEGCIRAAVPTSGISTLATTDEGIAIADDLVNMTTQMAVDADGTSTVYTINFVAPADTVPVYRLYNQYDGTHLYTTDANEVAQNVEIGWTDEGVYWHAPKTGTGSYTIVRLYNPFSGDHYYLPQDDENQLNELLGLGWEQDGESSWFDSAPSDSKHPIHVLFNPYRDVDTHLYTAQDNECNENVKLGWEEHTTTIWASAIPGVKA